jgi:polyisoprenyl-phosphate glycosyltransferase
MTTAPQREPPLISILIPVYNERKNVGLAVEAVKQQFAAMGGRYQFEIIFTDNHSEDGTDAELEALAASDYRIKVIRFARNFGFQRSVLTAYRYSKGAAAMQIDCDLQDPPELIPVFLERWEAGHDVVVGIRRKRQENWLLQAGRRAFYKLITAISDDNIVENAGDFRLVDRSVVDQLNRVNDNHPYTRGLVSSLAARQIGIEYDRRERKFEKSKFPLRRLTGFATNGIVSQSLVPLRLASFFGLTISFASFFIALYYIGAFLVAKNSWPPGFATLAILQLLTIGLNAVFIGIVGEYVGRIYDQIRVRPLTVVERTFNIEPRSAVMGPDTEHRTV